MGISYKDLRLSILRTRELHPDWSSQEVADVHGCTKEYVRYVTRVENGKLSPTGRRVVRDFQNNPHLTQKELSLRNRCSRAAVSQALKTADLIAPRHKRTEKRTELAQELQAHHMDIQFLREAIATGKEPLNKLLRRVDELALTVRESLQRMDAI